MFDIICLAKRLFISISFVSRKKIIYLIIFNSIQVFFEISSFTLMYPAISSALNGSLERFLNQDYSFYLLCFFIVISICLRFTISWLSIKTGKYIGIELAMKAVDANLNNFDFSEKIITSSEYISLFTLKVQSITSLLTAFVTLISSALVLITFTIYFLYTHLIIALSVFIILCVIYILFSIFLFGVLEKNSTTISFQSTYITQVIQESFYSLRDIILSNKQKYLLEKLKKAYLKFEDAYVSNSFFEQLPRYLIEIFFYFISFISLFFLSHYEQLNLLPLFITFVFAFQRLLPQVQLFFSSFSKLKGNRAVLSDILSESDFKRLYFTRRTIDNFFQYSFQLKCISFSYNKPNDGIHFLGGIINYSLKINKGDKIRISGISGSGKTTILELISCLRFPSRGELFIDENKIINFEEKFDESSLNCIFNWRSKISFVSSKSFFLNTTIYESVAFGLDLESIDHAQVEYWCEFVNLKEFIESLPFAYNTIIGDNGCLLSEGQLQRLSLARALYRLPSILILDEATSSLDLALETKLIEKLSALTSLTLIFVSHRSISDVYFNKQVEVNYY